MTNDDIWENNILESFEDLADIDNQRLSWLGLDSEQVSSFTEVLAMIYDNFDFKDYIKFYGTNYGEDDTYFKMMQLDKMISAYQDKGYTLEMQSGGVMAILNDPEWINIASKANEIVHILTKRLTK